jgi:hypothetical protein
VGNLENRLQKLENSLRGQEKPFLWVMIEPEADKETAKLLELAAFNAKHGTSLSVEDVNWLLFEVVEPS